MFAYLTSIGPRAPSRARAWPLRGRRRCETRQPAPAWCRRGRHAARADAGRSIGRAGDEQERCGGQGDDGVFHGVPGNGWACLKAVVAGFWLMKGLLGRQRRFIHKEAAGLAFPEIGVEAVALEQLLVSAFLHDAALIHDDEPVHGGDS